MFLNNVFYVLYLSSLVLFLCFKHLLHNFSFVIQGLCSVRFFKFWCLLRKCYIKGSKIYFQEPAALPFCGLVTESWRRSMRLTVLECTAIETTLSCDYATAWKTSVFEDILVHIFPHSDWIRREILRISPYSVQMRENTDQNNYKYRRFLRRVLWAVFSVSSTHIWKDPTITLYDIGYFIFII